jgi:hypothetical protein
MNPDANMQDQTTDQNDQNDPIMDNKYIVESAKQILDDERANPGSQDPAAVEWAQSKVNLPVAEAAPTYAQDPASQGSPDTLQVQHGPEAQPPQTPEDAQALQYLQQQQQAPDQQPAQPDASQEAASPDGHTLYIDRSQPEAPAQPNGTTNGDNNGNSN